MRKCGGTIPNLQSIRAPRWDRITSGNYTLGMKLNEHLLLELGRILALEEVTSKVTSVVEIIPKQKMMISSFRMGQCRTHPVAVRERVGMNLRPEELVEVQRI